MKFTLILLIFLSLMACSTTATIEDPQGLIYTYRGPKDVDFTIKSNGMEVIYSGKNPPWYHSMMPFLFQAVPDVVVK